MAKATTKDEKNNVVINSGLRADIMRKSIEAKDTLEKKGSLYVGRGTTTAITGTEYEISDTMALEAPVENNEIKDNYILTTDNSQTGGLKWSDSANLGGTLTVAGETILNSNFKINNKQTGEEGATDKFSISAIGNTFIGGTLIHGSSDSRPQVTINGNIDATNGIDITGASLNVGSDQATQDTNLYGKLLAKGETTLGSDDGHVVLSKTAITEGEVTTHYTTEVKDLLDVKGSTTLKALDTTDTAKIAKNGTVELSTSGKLTTVNGQFEVKEASQLLGNLTVGLNTSGGDVSSIFYGTHTTNGNVDQTGTFRLHNNSGNVDTTRFYIAESGNTTIYGTLTSESNTTLKGTLEVTGGDVTIGTSSVNKKLTVNGNLIANKMIDLGSNADDSTGTGARSAVRIGKASQTTEILGKLKVTGAINGYTLSNNTFDASSTTQIPTCKSINDFIGSFIVESGVSSFGTKHGAITIDAAYLKMDGNNLTLNLEDVNSW